MTGKTKKRKKSSKKSSKPHFFKTQLQRVVTGLVLLLLLVVLAGVLMHYFVGKKEKIPSNGQTAAQKNGGSTPPLFEIYTAVEAPVVKSIEKPKPLDSNTLPKVAVIIDDMGYDRAVAEKFIALDPALTFSLLPHSPFAVSIAQKIREKGAEMMLHLPMEPNEYPEVDPGPGTLLISMSPDVLIRQLEENIDAVPFVKGVNNHMGSKMTAASSQMYQVLSILKKRGLFFIDSRTTSDSLCRPSARMLRVPFAERDVFLDHIQSPESIQSQINRLVEIARHQGEAVGIAHPNMMTYDVLRRMLPDLKEKVRLVRASEIVHKAG